jgi:hypothetical protein
MAERGGEAAASSSAHCLTLVVLGAAGDLARKKTYPALHKLYEKVTTRPPPSRQYTHAEHTLPRDIDRGELPPTIGPEVGLCSGHSVRHLGLRKSVSTDRAWAAQCGEP